MNAIQKRCRPKHQVLVLNCYPKTTKGAVDVKPNSSELSYLLFYATSRRSKIQKVGGFLEKKTASDVWRLRIGNVQVTLQILAALIEKSPKDMPLFAPYVLKILDLVLRSDDLTMVESSLPTLAIFCENHDASSLQADQAYFQQYESVVQAYARLASTRHFPGRITPTKPVAMRWRNTGLEAIKSVASSDALSSLSALKLDVIVPMILENLWTDNENFLDVLLQRALSGDNKVDQEKLLLRRRTSIATVHTVETTGDTNPIAFSGSALDVDKLAEEDIGVLAIQCLKQIFVVPNRPQIHGATTALLSFIEERVAQDEVVTKRHPHTGHDHGWAIKMVDIVARWSPVQDRYVILVTIMETMMKMAMNDETMRQHLALASMAGSLLRSDINLIGLSVLDILLGLITQIRKVIHLPGARLDTSEHSGDSDNGDDPTPTELAAGSRKELLGRIQQCIGELATHVYYTDQIADMISAILVRLRPLPANSSANSSPAGERAEGQNGTGSVSNLADSQQLETYFSHNVGKISALRAVKSILLIANPGTKMSGNVNLLRNHVPISVWEGTQWMLRDPDGQVRKAYVDALVTWLDRETTFNDLKARDEGFPNHKNSAQKNGKELAPAVVARRAASSASAREKPKSSHSHFLQLLSVAIYDNVLQFVDFEGDLLLLHVLLTKLTTRLGINAVRHALPMIFRLQEDIQDAETPISKVRIGSLCHGFFWSLTEAFDFEASAVGRAIHNEIVRRRSKGFWIDGIHIPPPALEKLLPPGTVKPPPKLPLREIESEALLPFDDRMSLVDCISTGYQERSISPPVSPAGSPGRNYIHPISSNLSSVPTIEAEQEIPVKMREDMMILDWSREGVLSAIEEGSKSASLNGSRSGTTAFTNRNLLATNGGVPNDQSPNGPSSPVHSTHNRPLSKHEQASAANRLRKTSLQSAMSAGPGSVSSRGYVTTVEQLKLVLAGGQAVPPNVAGDPNSDDSSESMASYEYTPSELSFNPSQVDSADVGPGKAPVRSGSVSTRKASLGESLGPLNSHPPDEAIQGNGQENVPPVPTLPANLSHPRPATATASNLAVQDHLRASRKSLKSRGGDSAPPKHGFPSGPVPAMDLQALLLGLDSHAGETNYSSHTNPPY